MLPEILVINCLHAADGCPCHMTALYEGADLETAYSVVAGQAEAMGWVVLPAEPPSRTQFECHCHQVEP